MADYNFTPEVKAVVNSARENAVRLRHEYIGTEHQLLGIISREDCKGAKVLKRLGLDLDAIATNIENTVKRGKAGQSTGPDLPHTSRAKKVLELAIQESHEQGDKHIGSEHLLIGLVLEEKGIACQILVDESDENTAELLELCRAAKKQVEANPHDFTDAEIVLCLSAAAQNRSSFLSPDGEKVEGYEMFYEQANEFDNLARKIAEASGLPLEHVCGRCNSGKIENGDMCLECLGTSVLPPRRAETQAR